MVSAAVSLAATPEPARPDETVKNAATAAPQSGRSDANHLTVNAAELREKGLDISKTSPAPVLKPMTVEINAVLTTAAESVAALQHEFDQTSDDQRALELVRRIESVKTNAELDVLRVQLKYAQLEGQETLASQLAADLAEMTTPRPRRQPVERPATSAGSR